MRFAATYYAGLARGATLGAALARLAEAIAIGTRSTTPPGPVISCTAIRPSLPCRPREADTVSRQSGGVGRRRRGRGPPCVCRRRGRDAAAPAPPASSEAGLVVGRDDPLAELQRHLDTARRGVRGTVVRERTRGHRKDGARGCVSRRRAPKRRRMDRARTVDRTLRERRAYLPVLQALNHLATASDAPLAGWMRRHAPSWLTRLPRLVPAEQTAVPERGARHDPRTHGAGDGRAARGRERRPAARGRARGPPLERPLDARPSSAYLAERRDPARILLIGTYRPAESMRRDHPVARHDAGAPDAAARRGGMPRAPSRWRRSAEYLRARLGGRVDASAGDAGAPADGGHRSSRSPLVDWALRERGARRDPRSMGAGRRRRGARRIHARESSPSDRAPDRGARPRRAARARGGQHGRGRVLRSRRAAAALSAKRTRSRSAARRWCGGASSSPPPGVEEWPDGTVAGVLPLQTRALRRRARATDRRGPPRAHAPPRRGTERGGLRRTRARDRGELAAQFSAARDPGRAVAYHALAGDNAIQRYADHEAVQHLTRGLQLLAELPEDASRRERELALLVKLSTPLMSTKGIRLARGRTRVRARSRARVRPRRDRTCFRCSAGSCRSIKCGGRVRPRASSARSSSRAASVRATTWRASRPTMAMG